MFSIIFLNLFAIRMMGVKFILFLSLCISFFAILIEAEKSKGGLYSFKARTIDGEVTSLEQYRGKISLVVNVASECGYTEEHYQQLVALQNELNLEKNEPFTVLAFPCNQFGKQEPYDDADIAEFAKSTYGVNFPMFSKTEIIGNNAHPVYGYLTRNHGSEPSWNFWKYLIDEDGGVVGAWGPRTSVESIKKNILQALTALKAKNHNEL